MNLIQLLSRTDVANKKYSAEPKQQICVIVLLLTDGTVCTGVCTHLTWIVKRAKVLFRLVKIQPAFSAMKEGKHLENLTFVSIFYLSVQELWKSNSFLKTVNISFVIDDILQRSEWKTHCDTNENKTKKPLMKIFNYDRTKSPFQYDDYSP